MLAGLAHQPLVGASIGLELIARAVKDRDPHVSMENVLWLSAERLVHRVHGRVHEPLFDPGLAVERHQERRP